MLKMSIHFFPYSLCLGQVGTVSNFRAGLLERKQVDAPTVSDKEYVQLNCVFSL